MRVIEIVSYGLIVLLGARLLWVEGRSFIAALHALQAEPENTKTEARDNCHCHHALRLATRVSIAIKQLIMSISRRFYRGAMCTARSLRSCRDPAAGGVACLQS